MRFQKPPTGAVLNPLHPLSRGLVGYWLFNEGAGSLVNDISGHGNHGKLTNMLPNVQGSGWGGGKSGGILQFDGISDYVDCGNDASLDITDAITIETLVKPELLTSIQGIVARSYRLNYGMFINNNSKLRFSFTDEDDLGNHIIGNINMVIDVWQTVSITWNYSTGDIKYYLNGVLKDTKTGYTKKLKSTGWYDLHIGHGGGSERFEGLIDEVRIYNRALSAAEVKMLYECPFCNLI